MYSWQILGNQTRLTSANTTVSTIRRRDTADSVSNLYLFLYQATGVRGGVMSR
jgi:hypothetical protein